MQIKIIILQVVLLLFGVINGCTEMQKAPDYAALYGPSTPKQRLLSEEEAARRDKLGYVSYWRDVHPILENRCVVCHACYDAPCQLKLGSFEGIDRGATKQPVYDGNRMQPAAPTRLFIDAQDTADWRAKQFFPVLNEREDNAVAALDNSLLAKMLLLKRKHPLPASGKLPDTFKFELNRALECPAVEEFGQFQAQHPQWGMPYAFPGLNNDEQALIINWLEQGAQVAPRPSMSLATLQEIAAWEAFLNGPSAKERLVARYLYEHLFIGHIHFRGHANGEFFRLVRSTTPPGRPIAEIASVLPYDDPKVPRVYYRLRPIVETIVDKTHFVYEFSPERMQRYRKLFFEPVYTVAALPGYSRALDANPFKTFASLPVTSRYQFLLDDAEYFVSGFIKGPVCRGQTALNVIQDRFWVTFIRPGMHFVEQAAKFFADNSRYLTLPGAEGDSIGLFGWREYDALVREYLQKKEAFVDQAILHGDQGVNLDYIWDGGGTNENAALTVFRHFDSATVVKGLVGSTPKTAWVVDYPIFERLHYLLVAGFNVYGTVAHQLATRKYMDYLRIDAENNFLRFMPAAQRQKMHENWYQGVGAALEGLFDVPLFSIDHETAMVFRSTDYKQDFFRQLQQKLGQAGGRSDDINRCAAPPCVSSDVSATRRVADAAMRELAALQGKVLGVLPEMSLLRVVTGEPGGDLVYTLLVDKALKNVAFIFAEDLRRLPEQDKLTVVRGFLGSYPNFFFSVEKNALHDFIDALKNAAGNGAAEHFYAAYGIRRSDPRFWQNSDWFNVRYKREQGVNAGLFDLNRYDDL
ncbi:MAG: fatty acid cis/trans isomerase [Gammaproteobacteria bacterium]